MTSYGHGIARATRPRTDEERTKDLNRIGSYRTLENQFRQKARRTAYDAETFQITSGLLRLNPEYYTVWNVRRRCIISSLSPPSLSGSSPSKVPSSTSQSGISSDSSELPSAYILDETPQAQSSQATGRIGTQSDAADTIAAVLRDELSFTVPLLKKFPKCYWIWNYRLWILNEAISRLPLSVTQRIWQEELGLIGKMLYLDQRNFHAWGYRRYVVDKLESPELDGRSLVESEFNYTTGMIKNNLSNFSAWHYRSQLIPRMLSERDATDSQRKLSLEQELEYIRNGLSVDPQDQSLWFYHQFLISNLAGKAGVQTIAPGLSNNERRNYVQEEIDEIKDLMEDYKDIKWIYEALIQYTLVLNQLGTDDPAQGISQSLSEWLRKLQELDPQRSGRWADLEKQIQAT